MNDAERQTARVQFDMESLERVRREWYCGLVDEQAERDSATVTLLVYSLERLTGWLLSFGASAKVIAPERLKQLVTAEARNVLANYPPSPPANLQPRGAPRRSIAVSARH